MVLNLRSACQGKTGWGSHTWPALSSTRQPWILVAVLKTSVRHRNGGMPRLPYRLEPRTWQSPLSPCSSEMGGVKRKPVGNSEYPPRNPVLCLGIVAGVSRHFFSLPCPRKGECLELS